ncbi:hypothetical protein JTB14_014602 [Gonioctena quinquepunctata]|nr:hypothetical protein JTB14_014602 [Gonioctena quinquepunctata]
MVEPQKDDESDNCRGCDENYYKTVLLEDWLQCQVCMFWVHENYTEFGDMCWSCGQAKKKAKELTKKGMKKGKYRPTLPQDCDHLPGYANRVFFYGFFVC